MKISINSFYSILFLFVLFFSCRSKEEFIELQPTTNPDRMFRVGLEIETCFNGVNSEGFILISQGQINSNTLKCPLSGAKSDRLSFLSFMNESDPLFLAEQDQSIYCVDSFKDTKKSCPIEMMFNHKREFYTNGNGFFEKETGSFIKKEEELKSVFKDIIAQNAFHCAKEGGVSQCGTHVHISYPKMEFQDDWKKAFLKLYVFALWVEKYQNIFIQENLARNHTSAKHQYHYGKKKMEHVEVTTENTLDLMDQEFRSYLENRIFLRTPNLRETLLKSFKDTLKKELSLEIPTLSEISSFSKSEAINKVKQIPGEIKKDEKNTNNKRLYNLMTVDNFYKTPYPRFEFRGHEDFFLSYPSKNPEEVTRNLMNYFKKLTKILNEALDLTEKRVKALE